ETLAQASGGGVFAIRIEPRYDLQKQLLGGARTPAPVGVAHLAADVGTTLLWQMVTYVARLVDLAALHNRSAVDDEQHGSVDPEPSLDQVLHERGGHDVVLGRAAPDAERYLRTVLRHAQGDDDRVAADLDPVDEHRRERDVVELPVEKLGKFLRRLLDERATHVALALAA